MNMSRNIRPLVCALDNTIYGRWTALRGRFGDVGIIQVGSQMDRWAMLKGKRFSSSSPISVKPELRVLPANYIRKTSINGIARSFSYGPSRLNKNINASKKERDREAQVQGEPAQHTPDSIKDNNTQLSDPDPPREKLFTIPNILTFTRLFSAPIIGYLVIHHHEAWALGLFAYSCLTDLVDGYIARRYQMQSVVGSVIDPMADKFLMVTLASCLAVSGNIPIYLAVLILGRDFLLGLSALYYRYISLPPPKTFARYWDFSLPSAEVHPTTISKYNTLFQMLYLGASLARPVYEIFDTVPMDLGFTMFEYLVATSTVLSGLSYVFSNQAVKIITKRGPK